MYLTLQETTSRKTRRNVMTREVRTNYIKQETIFNLRV